MFAISKFIRKRIKTHQRNKGSKSLTYPRSWGLRRAFWIWSKYLQTPLKTLLFEGLKAKMGGGQKWARPDLGWTKMMGSKKTNTPSLWAPWAQTCYVLPMILLPRAKNGHARGHPETILELGFPITWKKLENHPSWNK